MNVMLMLWTFLTGSRYKGLLLEGERLLRMGNPQAAEKVFHAVVRGWPEMSEGFEGLARAYKDMGMLDQAQRELAFMQALRKVTAEPNDLTARLHLTKAFMDKGQLDLALLHAEHAQRLAPQDIDVLRPCAQVYWAAKRYGKALEATKAALRHEPLSVDLYNQLAAINRMRGDSVQYAKMRSLADALNKVSQDPGNLELVNNAVFQLTINDNRTLALEVVDRSLAAHPQSHQLQTLRAEIQLENLDIPGALKTLGKALELDATSERTHQLLMRAYLEGGQGNLAEKHQQLAQDLDEAYRLNDPVEREVRLTQVQIACNQAAKARGRAEALRQANPKDWRGPYSVAQVDMAQDHKEQALALLGEAAKLAPYEPQIPLSKARLHSKLGHHMEALGQARLAVSYAPKDPDVRLALANLLRSMGQTKLAQEEMEIAEVLRKRLGAGRAA